jgi:hypothetical protein
VRIFSGYDPREAAGYTAFHQSLIETSTDYQLMPPFKGMQGDGSTDFTYGRFRVPELCNWSGWAVSLDGADMLLRGDIKALAAFCDPSKALMVVKHDYLPRTPGSS